MELKFKKLDAMWQEQNNSIVDIINFMAKPKCLPGYSNCVLPTSNGKTQVPMDSLLSSLTQSNDRQLQQHAENLQARLQSVTANTDAKLEKYQSCLARLEQSIGQLHTRNNVGEKDRDVQSQNADKIEQITGGILEKLARSEKNIENVMQLEGNLKRYFEAIPNDQRIE